MWLFCPTKWFKLRSYQQNASIWCHFWSKYGYLNPCCGHTERYSLLFGDSFWRNDIIICFKCHNVAALHHLMVKTWKLLTKNKYFRSFLIKIGKFDPRGVNIQGHLLLFGNLFLETLSCIIYKVFLWLYCPTKWFKLRSFNKTLIVGVTFG